MFINCMQMYPVAAKGLTIAPPIAPLAAPLVPRMIASSSMEFEIIYVCSASISIDGESSYSTSGDSSNSFPFVHFLLDSFDNHGITIVISLEWHLHYFCSLCSDICIPCQISSLLLFAILVELMFKFKFSYTFW